MFWAGFVGNQLTCLFKVDDCANIISQIYTIFFLFRLTHLKVIPCKNLRWRVGARCGRRPRLSCVCLGIVAGPRKCGRGGACVFSTLYYNSKRSRRNAPISESGDKFVSVVSLPVSQPPSFPHIYCIDPPLPPSPDSRGDLPPAPFCPTLKDNVCYIVAAVLINDEGEVLMMQEAKR